ncbi:MAG: SGNH/GDSL hydrolase family protein [Acidobacteriota bacterium]|nr:SGNH/GDSL hydrolase family protein [Acidobacteriota bacterium]
MYDTTFGSSRRRLALNLAVLLVSTFVALALCEVGARLLLPAPQTVKVLQKEEKYEAPSGFERLDTKAEKSIDSVVLFGGPHGVRLRPNTRGEIHNHVLSGRDIVIEVNSLGLRYAELGPKPEGEFRVLVLGDSITFGDFVLESETWTRQMESLTEGRKKTIRFVNAGLPGAGTAEELALFREIGEHVKPDLVLVGMYLNDAQSGSLFFTKKLPDPWAKSRFLSWLSDRFQILDSRFFRNAFPGEIDPAWRETFRAGRNLKSGDMMGARDGFDFEIYNAYMDFGLGWNPKAWTIIEAITAALRDAVNAQGARLAVVLFPVHIQVMGTVENFEPQESCLRMCARLDVPFDDPLPFLRRAWQANHERLFYDHCHYRPNGYAALAKQTVEFLDSKKLIPPSGR